MADLWVVKENTKFGTDFILLKDKAPRLQDKTAKSYAVKLLEYGVLDIRKAKEYRH